MAIVRYFADEDFRARIVKAVQRREPSIEFISVHDAGLSGAPDSALLEFAQQERWLLVSHDVNTMTKHANERMRSGRNISGLLLAEQFRGDMVIADSLILIWSATELEEWANRIQYLPI